MRGGYLCLLRWPELILNIKQLAVNVNSVSETSTHSLLTCSQTACSENRLSLRRKFGNKLRRILLFDGKYILVYQIHQNNDTLITYFTICYSILMTSLSRPEVILNHLKTSDTLLILMAGVDLTRFIH